MDSLTKASGVAVSVLVAATASVLLLLPGHPRMRTSRGAGMTPAVMVASATATPPRRPAPTLSGAAHRCLPPVAPSEHCRVSGDSTGGARAATAGRRRCRHGPPTTSQSTTGQPGTGRERAGWGTTNWGTTNWGTTNWGTTNWGSPGRGSPGRGSLGRGSLWRAGTPSTQRRPSSQPPNCPTGIPRRPR
jgi:hypothetical protein